MSGFRINDLSKSRLLDRNKRLSFHFDGVEYCAYKGDSVASALLSFGVTTVGRSFKYHRRRGIMSNNESEPNALVTILHEDGSRTPNERMPCLQVEEGLAVESQNRFPSLSFDILSINNYFSRFMPAGFYYKTFMGPMKKSWMWFEPTIRKAAGLGKANYEKDKDFYDHYAVHPQILIIGSGASALTAAYQAAQSGVQVLLLEQSSHFGGRLLSESLDSDSAPWLEDILAKLHEMPNVRMESDICVFGWYDHNILGAYEKKKGKQGARLWRIYAGSVILASGALERAIAFGNNDLPNVMLSSALRAFANGYGVLAGKEIVLFANDDSAYECAFDIMLLGFKGEVKVCIVDARHEEDIDNQLLVKAKELGVKILASHVVVKGSGRKKIEACHIATFDNKTGEIGSMYETLSCDVLATAGGWTPTLHLNSQIGGKPIYNEDIYAFVPQPQAEKGHFCIGSCAGVYGASQKSEQAITAALRAVEFVGGTCERKDFSLLTGAVRKVATPLFFVRAVQGDKQGKVFLDMQNDVSLRDVEIANLEGYNSVEHMKRYTTLGMATDQGKVSNMAAFHILASLQGKSVAELGTTTFRPPYTGVPIGVLAGRETGEHFRVLRKIPLHDWHLSHGAKMINSVAWQRPWYYPKGDEAGKQETVQQAYIREMTHVRGKVGLCDVSTLGKIAVIGEDAGEFLDRVYINGFKKLGIGRVRYGVMLRDDGFVLDDGTVTRISEHEYFMTTTTVEAEVVFRRLEFLLESEWSDLRVQIISVSDEWCSLALAGPLARDVLGNLVCEDVSDGSLPFMSYMAASLRGSGLPVRLFRISFSGELGYEICVRRFDSEKLAEACMESGKDFGLDFYGLEALGGLRIEQGFLTSAEIDGRHGLGDLGLEGLASSKKNYVGGVLGRRDIFSDEERPCLVGLKALDVNTVFRNGSLIYADVGEISGYGLGYISSVTWSPSLNCYIALAFIVRSAVQVGRRVRVSYPLKDEAMSAEITDIDFLGRS